jgi:hypothetical protein
MVWKESDQIQLRAAGDPDTVKCRMEGRGSGLRTQPAPGISAVVKGRVRGRGMLGNITLDGCEVVEP